MIMYTTTDGGQSFVKRSLPFHISNELIFHTSPDHKDYIMATQNKVCSYRL